ncbi:metalloendopeptidase [Malassezia pachydermatis]|uniref:Endothelin-converting enzyme 1 n=1 Tax=Malassezia pachydermatis TaxID=77020 RepID=A0A0N0RSE6_9BASI|nr:endothelin-converting enzyme 1 [Malassezia pachydermatis]KOS14703.1 endothelin-converting enzyme 1 [Malassezia pachydermatis]
MPARRVSERTPLLAQRTPPTRRTSLADSINEARKKWQDKYHPSKARPRDLFVLFAWLCLLVFAIIQVAGLDDRRVLDQVCISRECVMAATGLMRSMNTTADPCDDFYEYATGGWRASHSLPDDKSRIGIFDDVDTNNEAVLRSIFTGPVDDAWSNVDRANVHKLQTWYASCMNTSALAQQGDAPLRATIEAMPSGHSSAAVAKSVAYLHQYDFPAWFDVSIEGDEGEAPTIGTPVVAPSGLSLPDPTYYQDNDTMHLFKEAVHMAARSLRAVDVPFTTAQADDVVALESKLAAITPSAVAMSDPMDVYNPMTFKELQRLCPSVDWHAYFAAMGARTSPHRVIVRSKAYLHDLDAVWRSTSAATRQAYAQWKMVLHAGAWLSPDAPLAQPGRRLRNALQGLAPDTEMDRSHVCVQRVNRALGFMAGRYYVKRALKPGDRVRMTELIEALRQAFYHRLDTIPWLDDDTRDAARAKAEAMTIRIGFPDEPKTKSAHAMQAWYTDLPATDDAYANELAARRWQSTKAWSYLGAPLNLRGLGDMTTVMVNAEYIPPFNQIVFPAGILQPPFFDSAWPMYMQFAAIGMVAGHELSHAFDPHGRLYDAKGYLRDWWTPATAKAYEERQACIEAQYGNYSMDDGKGGRAYIQSRLTVGEDVADAGGLAQSYRAWQATMQYGGLKVYEQNRRLPGLDDMTQEQLFFLSFAQIWASQQRTEEAVRLIKTDPHSPERFRVNGALANFPPFAKAFGCRAGPTSFVHDEQTRCDIW